MTRLPTSFILVSRLFSCFKMCDSTDDAATGNNPIDKYFSAKSDMIQNVVNNSFVLRLNKYCLNADDEYGCKPVFIVFSIKNTTKTILKESSIRTSTFFAYTLLSFPWAEECILLDADTIKEHINEKPLHPLVV
ncbi:hypothetical protein BDA99DRAFT_505436 [Phascolomyces articulosus]|uniref:Uncharacterized protein n=1 Tax=Phascolomyces articulosus TaxID=60185 RepID=A0AAD5PFK5_9FUNG|nr:hypothetical protein BDA99DRAFT_505436 [Phascolomyces articulosus]